MNQFYKCVDLLKSRLESNENVNTVLFGNPKDKDLYKKNIYPLAHINPVNANFTSENVCEFTFEIAALDQRDLSKSIATQKFDGNDDLQDNLNISFTIINDLITWLRRQNNDDMIELTGVSSAQPVLFTDYNLLDGWVVSITIEIPNKQTVC